LGQIAELRRVVIPYAPRPLQLEIHEALEGARFGAVVCHRRFGKTVAALNHLLKSALTCQRQRPRFAYIAPTYRQGKAIAWDYLKHYAGVIPGMTPNESELRVDLPNESQVRIFGADNPDALRGLYFDGAVLDEMGMMDDTTFSQVVRPALSDRQGWALFIGTPNGKNAYWDICQHAQQGAAGWFFRSYPASVTGLIPEEELAAARSVMTPDEFAQEYECSFEASVKGAIYAMEIAASREAGRIGSVPYDPALPVHTAWDLGVGDATAVWFAQQHAGEVRLIDYYEASGEGLPHYAAVLQRKGYAYGQHWAPHDVQVRELGSGRSRIEVAAALGIRFSVAPQVGLEDGIHAVRMLLPRCRFDGDRCKPGLEALQGYRRDYNTRLGEFKATPVHDWASHGADALRYLAVSLTEKAAPKPSNRSPAVAGWMG